MGASCRRARRSRVRFRLGLVIATLAALVLLLPFPLPIFALTLAGFSIFMVLFMALGDAMAVDALPSPERQYGSLRALSSLAFAVGVLAAGFIYDAAGYVAVPVVSLAGSVTLLLIVGGSGPDAGPGDSRDGGP